MLHQRQGGYAFSFLVRLTYRELEMVMNSCRWSQRLRDMKSAVDRCLLKGQLVQHKLMEKKFQASLRTANDTRVFRIENQSHCFLRVESTKPMHHKGGKFYEVLLTADHHIFIFKGLSLFAKLMPGLMPKTIFFPKQLSEKFCEQIIEKPPMLPTNSHFGQLIFQSSLAGSDIENPSVITVLDCPPLAWCSWQNEIPEYPEACPVDLLPTDAADLSVTLEKCGDLNSEGGGINEVFIEGDDSNWIREGQNTKMQYHPDEMDSFAWNVSHEKLSNTSECVSSALSVYHPNNTKPHGTASITENECIVMNSNDEEEKRENHETSNLDTLKDGEEFDWSLAAVYQSPDYPDFIWNGEHLYFDHPILRGRFANFSFEINLHNQEGFFRIPYNEHATQLFAIDSEGLLTHEPLIQLTRQLNFLVVKVAFVLISAKEYVTAFCRFMDVARADEVVLHLLKLWLNDKFAPQTDDR